MKRIAIAVCVVVLAMGVAVIAQTPAQPTSGSVERELIELEKEWAAAVTKPDLTFLNLIWADEYSWTSYDGTVWSKAQTLESLRSGKDVVSSAMLDDVKVRVFGDAAVVTGRSIFNETLQGKDIGGQERFTDTWVRRSGRWQCVAMHCSRIAQE